MYFQKTRLWFWAATIGALMLLCGALAYAQLPSEVDETSVAITYNDIAGSRGWGVLGALPFGNPKTQMGILLRSPKAVALLSAVSIMPKSIFR